MAGDTGQCYDVPLDWIAHPIGWEPRYTIHCEPDQANTIITNWFTRGIVVRANQCIGDSAGSTFQPADNSAQPHWKYPKISDSVSAELCAQVFRVIVAEEEEIGSTAATRMHDPTCDHCKGTGRRLLAELATIRNQSTAKLKELMLLPDEPYKVSDKLHLDNYNASDETFDCHCHYGMFRRLGRSKRAKLIKQWAIDGWVTRYLPYAGGYWIRTRETIVHDWQ